MRVSVRKNNINKAMSILNRKLAEEGITKELFERRYYLKPSVRKRMAKKAAIKRALKDKESAIAKIP